MCLLVGLRRESGSCCECRNPYRKEAPAMAPTATTPTPTSPATAALAAPGFALGVL